MRRDSRGTLSAPFAIAIRNTCIYSHLDGWALHVLPTLAQSHSLMYSLVMYNRSDETVLKSCPLPVSFANADQQHVEYLDHLAQLLETPNTPSTVERRVEFFCKQMLRHIIMVFKLRGSCIPVS